MNDILIGILKAFIYSMVGIFISIVLNKLSLLLFNINFSKEIKAGNKAAAILFAGLLILIGLIIGLISM